MIRNMFSASVYMGSASSYRPCTVYSWARSEERRGDTGRVTKAWRQSSSQNMDKPSKLIGSEESGKVRERGGESTAQRKVVRATPRIALRVLTSHAPCNVCVSFGQARPNHLERLKEQVLRLVRLRNGHGVRRRR